jgi:hypothetical protein
MCSPLANLNNEPLCSSACWAVGLGRIAAGGGSRKMGPNVDSKRYKDFADWQLLAKFSDMMGPCGT